MNPSARILPFPVRPATVPRYAGLQQAAYQRTLKESQQTAPAEQELIELLRQIYSRL